ncbi:MAG: toll/interleukin-1 receptor domain-containing protein [Anaerolineae bacterium]|nr:toll/interleukin-1 receptor domain-containing protein [Anaerolineae bacterium]
MYNPLEDPVPDDPVQRVHAFARLLAFGAVQGLWAAEVRTEHRKIWFDEKTGKSLEILLPLQWKYAIPDISLLASFSFLERTHFDRKLGNEIDYYILTPKAFDLLSQPAPTSIFISYRRKSSSMLALLVFARLKAIDFYPFLDIQDIGVGDNWHAWIEDQVIESENLICLLSPDTLAESEWVRKEIALALQHNRQVIPIWHNGFDAGTLDKAVKTFPELTGLVNTSAIEIDEDSKNLVEEYNNAMNKLLNRFGVTPS